MSNSFYSIYSHGFMRVAVAIPSVRVADCNYNVERTLHLARRASKSHIAIVLFPELGISAYSNEDLFHQDALLDNARSALDSIKTQSRDILSIIVVGAPLRFEGKLFNCAVVIYKGRCLESSQKHIFRIIENSMRSGSSRLLGMLSSEKSPFSAKQFHSAMS